MYTLYISKGWSCIYNGEGKELFTRMGHYGAMTLYDLVNMGCTKTRSYIHEVIPNGLIDD